MNVALMGMFECRYPTERAFRRAEAFTGRGESYLLGLRAASAHGSGSFDSLQPSQRLSPF